MNLLQGNIRVVCRLKPTAMGIPDLKYDEETVSIRTDKGDKLFRFQRVFGPETTQDMMFSASKHMIQSAIEGSQIMIFTYGATGSGKTHTLFGAGDGVVPRSLDLIFEQQQIVSFF
ncbi:protein claret segregational-like [Thrips palmi]|uniref:Protein claret segregational-like n=1 Tax=Thrips palmi TaxID=161013 RepID=A0A6P8ZH10_THRPL|nr:protein claret segregational-like [Thrips palmi]